MRTVIIFSAFILCKCINNEMFLKLNEESYLTIAFFIFMAIDIYLTISESEE